MTSRSFYSRGLWRLLPFLMAAVFMLPAFQAGAIDIERLLSVFARYKTANAQNFSDWSKLLQNTRDLSTPDKLRRVNEFFNRRIQFDSDQVIWGQSEYWATPMETLATGKGDCEDFTIAKYFTLLNLKIPNEQLRLIYVKARIGGPSSSIEQAHMVLAYYSSPEAEPLVLDNLITDIRPAGRRPDLLPIFSFNSQGVYAGVSGQATSGLGGISQLSRWSELLQRARAEGFE